MGLFDLFRRRTPPAAPQMPLPPRSVVPEGQRRFHRDRSRMFDLSNTQALVQLLAVPHEARDHDWSERFHDAVWTASVYVPEPKVISGPDGMPYLRLVMPPHGLPFDSQCLANVAPGCIDDLCGAALFASEGDPAEAAHYVFPMGVLESLLRYDSPDGDPLDAEETARPERADAGGAREVLVATPSADYLPPHLAFALFRYLTQVWALAEPRIALLVDPARRPTRSLVVGRKLSEFPADADIELMVRYLLWYLPPGRTVTLMPEDWRLEDMTPLAALFDEARV